MEDTDFISFLGKSIGGRPTHEYHLSIDMAKKLSMVERNEKGR
jgi:phage anti-repressor protein